MVLLTVIALLLGIAYGLSGIDITIINFIAEHTHYILYLLMFLVGISIGLHRGLIQKIKEYHVKIFIIPFGIIIGSLLGGIVCSFMTGISMNTSTAMASGLGWYSLSGVMISEFAGVSFGSITFLSSLMREIFSFISIPFIAKYFNFPTCIAPAGATSEDTTLPMLIRYTNEETVVLSVINGILCSAAVPILINLCYQIF
ncbi:MAG TPA: hypothetical protein DHW61_07330 [Lachnoclostridium phytofermentans]|uniref:Lysine exporter LysO family protein n=1 Tax=Lachnoclostridium phytofermentans TaxID=66219 RepID=A0A3D2X528_9FIRM|nr:lysine exporter LysO family protein [Lachnoclostridium sp.]HCL02212.1 hypothetical protein [Lachnoclostridium phytofermentans]